MNKKQQHKFDEMQNVFFDFSKLRKVFRILNLDWKSKENTVNCNGLS